MAAAGPRLDCDVLVLGAGLAGGRAAWAAAETAPGLRVLLASPRAAPSGSSFANRNDALGMQVPQPDATGDFVAEVLRLAPPGEVRPELVSALAGDARARLADLLDLGLSFRRGPDGSLRRYPGCFSAAPRAVIFDGLARAHAAFARRLHGLGVALLPGFAALGLARSADGRVCGAHLAAARGEKRLDVRATAVVAALGGPAALFARRICGPSATGLSYGLLASAGARLVNAPYVQFLWSRADTLDFINPGDLTWPEPLAQLAAARRTHCPAAYGRPDGALDLALLARTDARGRVSVPQGSPLVLAAQAGNGGARIDAQGRTDVPGLYACGECAGGMHGANRLGGGMVLAALVFGARAGTAAAQDAAGRCSTSEPASAPPLDCRSQPEFLRRLRRDMQRHAPPGPPRPGRQAVVDRLTAAAHSPNARTALLARSALAVLGAKT